MSSLSQDSSLFYFNKYIQQQDKILIKEKLKEYYIVDDNASTEFNTSNDEDLNSIEFKNIPKSNGKVSVFSSNEKPFKKLRSIKNILSENKEQMNKKETFSNPFLIFKKKLNFNLTSDTDSC